jgi:hypothetical protein
MVQVGVLQIIGRMQEFGKDHRSMDFPKHCWLQQWWIYGLEIGNGDMGAPQDESSCFHRSLAQGGILRYKRRERSASRSK